ncbi:MAG TPA: protein-disulfide reductase DsbD N-terminal domain-containing protein [Blastocatellia bacterium]
MATGTSRRWACFAAGVFIIVQFVAPATRGQDSGQKFEAPITWSVGRDKEAEVLQPGAEFKVRLVAKIKDGWHLYSLDEPPSGPGPTEISLPKGQPFEMAGDIDSPIGTRALDPNFGIKTEYYERSATFVVPVRALAGASGRQKLVVEVRYQSCSEQLCLAPKTEKLELSVDVQPK